MSFQIQNIKVACRKCGSEIFSVAYDEYQKDKPTYDRLMTKHQQECKDAVFVTEKVGRHI